MKMSHIHRRNSHSFQLTVVATYPSALECRKSETRYWRVYCGHRIVQRLKGQFLQVLQWQRLRKWKRIQRLRDLGWFRCPSTRIHRSSSSMILSYMEQHTPCSNRLLMIEGSIFSFSSISRTLGPTTSTANRWTLDTKSGVRQIFIPLRQHTCFSQHIFLLSKDVQWCWNDGFIPNTSWCREPPITGV